ncbi:MAG: DUF2135 domain-containing protein [Candidatus Accumulibacter sp.]|jgi:uncharacterized protein YfaP (DUF2135 family)|nr:DUF2135 domain-containing protein [Accumulibacter sp.]
MNDAGAPARIGRSAFAGPLFLQAAPARIATAARAAALGLIVLFRAASALAQEPPIVRPLGGWNHGGAIDREEEAAVAYPYNLIDRGAQRGRALIQGRLAGARDAQRSGKTPSHSPPTLVVNGNPMPLYADGEGRFARPYAFGPGSNSVELKSREGESLQRLQFYEANPARPRAGLRAILSWDDPRAEVDLHVLTPDGQHAFWAAPVLNGGGGMDVDSVDGAGPEIFSVVAPMRGLYRFYVNYWGNFDEGGYHFRETRQKPIITCRITLILNENTPDERRESHVVPLRRTGDLTPVRALVF